MNGRVVQVVKTFDGGLWAIQQVSELIKMGWDVHVITPKIEGRYQNEWLETGAKIHVLPCEFPVRKIWQLPKVSSDLVTLIDKINPDIIHSHFVSNTLLLRYALRDRNIPRIFQVPGPLHLEYSFFGQWETMWANSNDFWIASSDFIRSLYTDRYQVHPSRVFLSYYGTELKGITGTGHDSFRKRFGIPTEALLLGNVSFIYPPKLYLGQKIGIKGHELMIDAIADAMKKHSHLWAVFIGQQWGGSQKYFEQIKRTAQQKSNRFIFTGYIPQKEIINYWSEFDLAMHLPFSENCGGVIEPMLNEVPTIASAVGGLPEVVLHGKTGFLAQKRTVEEVSKVLEAAISDPQNCKKIAAEGKQHVERLFDIKRTSSEIDQIYKHVINIYKKN